MFTIDHSRNRSGCAASKTELLAVGATSLFHRTPTGELVLGDCGAVRGIAVLSADRNGGIDKRTVVHPDSSEFGRPESEDQLMLLRNIVRSPVFRSGKGNTAASCTWTISFLTAYNTKSAIE